MQSGQHEQIKSLSIQRRNPPHGPQHRNRPTLNVLLQRPRHSRKRRRLHRLIKAAVGYRTNTPLSIIHTTQQLKIPSTNIHGRSLIPIVHLTLHVYPRHPPSVGHLVRLHGWVCPSPMHLTISHSPPHRILSSIYSVYALHVITLLSYNPLHFVSRLSLSDSVRSGLEFLLFRSLEVSPISVFFFFLRGRRRPPLSVSTR